LLSRWAIGKAKNNLAPDKNALSYMTGAKMIGTCKRTGKEIWAPHVIWGAQHVEITATEAMQAEAGGKQSGRAMQETEQFLRNKLAHGPVRQKDIVDEAKQDGVSLRTLERAKKELRVESSKLKDEWLWSLPGADKPFSERGEKDE
jgi:putative DNA primase/helicase